MLLAVILAGAACRPAGRQSPAATPSPPREASPSASAAPSPTGSLLVDPPVVLGPESVAGWWTGREWVRAEGRIAEIPARGGDTYSLVTLTGNARTATGSAPAEGCETVPGSARIEVPGLVRSTGLEPPPIAVSRISNPRPRSVEILDPRSAVYREAATALLKERGLEDPDGDVVQVVKVDLEGDGRDEVLVVAERIADGRGLFAQVGDYSIVFLRRVVDDQPTTAVVSESIPKPRPDETPFITSHRVAAIADLNGDGRMEVALSELYYEGAGVSFQELKPDGSVTEVLRSGCGA